MNDLYSILTLDIPEVGKPEDGFLEIIRLSHNENVNSRIYSFFLNSTNNQSISLVFLNSLLKLINEKSNKKLDFDSFIVDTEVQTKKGNRIDICIIDEGLKTAIIIENKIYHIVINDLEDYWNHIAYKNKVGVLLTLTKADVPIEVKDKFINITHKEWIDEIKAIGFPSSLPIKTYVYINDFIQTIENLSINTTMNDSAEFYFKNAKKVNSVVATAEEAYKFIDSELEVVASVLDLESYGKNRIRRNFWNKESDHKTFFTVVFDSILKGVNTITIAIEVNKGDIVRIPEMEELIKEKITNHRLSKGGAQNSGCTHFLEKKYNLDLQDLKGFANFILGKIEQDFEPVMTVLMNEFYAK